MNVAAVISVLEDARSLVMNDLDAWSPWADPVATVGKIDAVRSDLRLGNPVDRVTLRMLFAATGPIQEVSMLCDWVEEFDEIDARFEAAVAE